MINRMIVFSGYNPVIMRFFLLLFLATFLLGCEATAPSPTPVEDAVIESSYDSLLAARLGADEYGMRSYVMAFLKAGPNRSQDSTEAAALQRAHLQNINRLAEAGQLVLAGPFLDDGEVRGIYIFNVPTVEEAEALTNTDPAIQAGRLVMELHPWYGSAALVELNERHQRLEKRNVAE